MAYDDDFIKEVREAANADPVTIIKSYMKLEKVGNDHVGCCPFHGEKTPSFRVYSGNEPHYHCYGGCGGTDQGHGDSMKFIMLKKNVDFIGAIKEAAAILGISEKFKKQTGQTPEELKKSAHLNTMKVAMMDAATIYANELGKHDEVIMYLVSRGFTRHDISTFGIGYATKGYTFLHKQLKDKYSPDVLSDSSLIYYNNENSTATDFLHSRIIFPIRDERSGHVVGFAGRVIGTQQANPKTNKKPAKYKNSGATELFKKSELLYGLYESIQAPPPAHSRRYLVTEGYTDVIAAHRHGYTNTVAAMGTGFNATLGRKLFIRGDQIVFGQDGDNAGIKAVYRSIKEIAPLLTPEKSCAVMLMPSGEDFDSLLLNDPVKFAALYDQPMSMSEFVAQHVLKMHGNDEQGRAKALVEVEELINAIQHNELRLSMRQAIYDKSGITIAKADETKQVALSNDETKKVTFAQLGEKGQRTVSSLSEPVKALVGMLLRHPSWFEFISHSALNNSPAISANERAAINFAIKSALGDVKATLGTPLGQYLAAHAPTGIDDQLKLMINFNQAPVLNDELDCAQNNESRLSPSMSNY